MLQSCDIAVVSPNSVFCKIQILHMIYYMYCLDMIELMQCSQTVLSGNLQEDPQDEEILRILSGMRISDDGASGSTPDWDFIPMMQNMMKSLMSKEVLYPSLKDIAEKVICFNDITNFFAIFNIPITN